jgi:TonB family protein
MFTMNVPSGETFDIKLSHGSDAWQFAATPSQEPDGTLRFSADLSHNGSPFSHPVLLAKANEPAGIKIGEQSADGSFKGFEARVTMSAHSSAPAASGLPTQHATYRSISRIPYPAAQAKAGVGGTVFVLAHIAVDGHVVSTGLKSGPGNSADVYPLVAAALQGVQGWTFHPAQKGGKPVPSDEIVPIVFMGAQPLNALKIEGELDPIEVASTSPLQTADDYSGPSENVDFRKMHPPKYPLAAIKAKQTGHIVLKVLVSSTGEPESAEVYEAKPAEASQAFADSSIAAVMQWRFNPGTRDGAPVAGYVLIPFDYNITDDDDDKAPAAKASDNS